MSPATSDPSSSTRPRSPDAKKMKKETESDGERSDADLVVDDDDSSKGNNGTAANNNGNRSPRENGDGSKKDPLSPSSARSTPASSSGKKEEAKTASGSPGAAKILPPKAAALGALGKVFRLKRKGEASQTTMKLQTSTSYIIRCYMRVTIFFSF